MGECQGRRGGAGVRRDCPGRDGISAGTGIGFELSAEQRELRELAHEFAERELRPIARECDEREDFPPELLGKAAALG